MIFGPGALQKLLQSLRGYTQVVIIKTIVVSLSVHVSHVNSSDYKRGLVNILLVEIYPFYFFSSKKNIKDIPFIVYGEAYIGFNLLFHQILNRCTVKIFFCFLYTPCKLPINMKNFIAWNCKQSCHSVKALHYMLNVFS